MLKTDSVNLPFLINRESFFQMNSNFTSIYKSTIYMSQEQQKLLVELAHTKMPFGKYEESFIFESPRFY